MSNDIKSKLTSKDIEKIKEIANVVSKKGIAAALGVDVKLVEEVISRSHHE